MNSTVETGRIDGSDVSNSNVHTPGKSGADLDAPSRRRDRSTSQDGKEDGRKIFRARLDFTWCDRVGNFAVNQNDFNKASRSPVLGWPAYNVLFGIGGPMPHIEHSIFDKANFQNVKAEIC